MAGKKSAESEKWQKHMEKKAGTKSTGRNSEIHRPEKKKPIEGRKIETKEKKAAQGKPITPQKEKTAQAKAPEKKADTHEQPKAEAAPKKVQEQAKPEEKPQEKAPKADEKPKRKKAKQKSRKVIAKRSEAIIAQRAIAQSAMALPTFRGRFGKRNIRRKSKAKWNRWRVPRGIDVKREISDGYMPRTGYATPRAYRHLHPSGYREFVVRTLGDVSIAPKDHAVRIAAGIGSRKKIAIVDKAISSGLRVLNP